MRELQKSDAIVWLPLPRPALACGGAKLALYFTLSHHRMAGI